MPFKSQAQRRWMYSQEPEMAKRWEKDTPKGKKLPKKVKKPDGGVKKAYNPALAQNDIEFQKWYSKNTLEGQRGVPFSDKLDYDYYSWFANKEANGNIEDHFPDTYKRPGHPTFSNESIYSIPENPGGHWEGETFVPPYQRGLRLKKPDGGIIDPREPNYAWQSMETPIVQSPYQGYLQRQVDPSTVARPGIDTELSHIQAPNLAGRQSTITTDNTDPKNKMNPFFALRGVQNGLSWLSGKVERGRQNQYLYNQLSSMGQMDPSPVENYQPNRFSLYSKYGGSLKKYSGGGPTDPTVKVNLDKGGDYDTIPSYAWYAKAIRDNNSEGARLALEHVTHVRGQETATALQFLGKDMRYSSLGDLAKRKVAGEKDPQMKQFYSMVNENPNLLDNFDMYMPRKSEDMASKEEGGLFDISLIKKHMKKGGGFKLNPANKGDCTPMTKSTCTGKKRQFALNAKRHFKKHKG